MEKHEVQKESSVLYNGVSGYKGTSVWLRLMDGEYWDS